MLDEITNSAEYVKDHSKEISKHISNGGSVIEPTTYQLAIDYDSDNIAQFQKNLKLLQSYATKYDSTRKFSIHSLWPSKSGNWHIIVECSEPMEICEQIMFQLILGSDKNRELHVYFRSMCNESQANILFKP